MNALLVELLETAVKRLQDRGTFPHPIPIEIQVERPRGEGHGDFASNLALQLAKSIGKPPREVAEAITDALPEAPELERVEIAGPGFINFHLTEATFQAIVPEILQAGARYGQGPVGKGEKVQIEFVSANPTGPLHVGHGRGAAYGDTLARIMEAAGYSIKREYYVNDTGRQIDLLALSVFLHYQRLATSLPTPFPEQAYQGDYVKEIAEELLQEFGLQWILAQESLSIPEEEDPEVRIDALLSAVRINLGTEVFDQFRERALTRVLGTIRADLEAFEVTFDEWVSERALAEAGKVERALRTLADKGLLYTKQGTTWFSSSQFSDEKDRVVVRKTGELTYFASDIGYHWHKFQCGFDHIINIWGADHHGYVARVRAAVTALGLDPELLEILLVQFANLYRGTEKVSMSTRAGQYVTLRELMAEIGRDAARFFYVLRRADQHLDFDLELAKRHTEDNPVYYVQYAHTRIYSLYKKLDEQGYTCPELTGAAVGRLCEAKEAQLLRLLARYPEVVAGAAVAREPHRVARFLQELAGEFHPYYNAHRILVEDLELMRARLALAEGVRQVIANGLELLGVSAPKKM